MTYIMAKNGSSGQNFGLKRSVSVLREVISNMT